MTRKRLKSCLLRASLFFIVFALTCGALSCSSPTPPDLIEVDIVAPDFTLPTMRGTEITLSDLQGTPVVLNFWAIRCPTCRRQMPYFDAVAKKYADKVTIVAINLEDSTSEVKQFFGDNEVSFIVALDKNAQMTSSYATGYIPTTFFIDSQGVIRYLKVGPFADEKQLQASIDKLLNKGG